ncbi:MAG: hypothetical protein AAF219_00220 [Myxococcota bacterium]
MAKAILLDVDTVLIGVEGEFKSAKIDDLSRILKSPTDIAVVPTDISKIVAQGEGEIVDKQIMAKLPAGSVYCHEKLGGPEHQIFSIPESLLQQLRSSQQVLSVVPYGVAVRDSQRSTELSLVDRISRVVGLGGPDDDGPTDDVVCIDRMGNRVVLTAIQGLEIKAVRTLYPGDDLAREVFVTLQGAAMPESRLLTPDDWIAERLREAGQEITQVRVPAEAPSFALHGLKSPSDTRFYLPVERAHMRKKAIAKQERRSLIGSAFFAVVCAVIYGGMLVWNSLVQSEIGKLNERLRDYQPQLEQLYQERYAGFVSEFQYNLPQAWAELLIMMPPQLDVKTVSISPGKVEAVLSRRKVDEGLVDPPLSYEELRAAVDRTGSWRGATLHYQFRGHEVDYRLEKLHHPGGGSVVRNQPQASAQ